LHDLAGHDSALAVGECWMYDVGRSNFTLCSGEGESAKWE
jgi:hypothetical protein